MGGGFFLLTFALPPRVHRQSTIRHEAITGDIACFRADEEQRHRHNVLVEIAHARDGAGCDFDKDKIGRDTSELQSLMRSSYAVFCLKKKKNNQTINKKLKLNTKQTIPNTTKTNVNLRMCITNM